MKKNFILKSALCLTLAASILTMGACKSTGDNGDTTSASGDEQAAPVYYTDVPGSVKKSETVYVNMDNSGDVGKVFDLVVRFYEHINEALEAFHAATDKGEFRAMALKTEELMLANSRDYTTVLELWARWDEDGGSKTTFDGYVGELTEKEQDNHD